RPATTSALASVEPSSTKMISAERPMSASAASISCHSTGRLSASSSTGTISERSGADEPSGPRIAGDMRIAPELKGQKGPQRSLVVLRSGQVLAHESADRLRAEEARAPEPLLAQELFQQRPERPAQPRADRHAEALLSPIEDRVGQATRERPLEDVLRP